MLLCTLSRCSRSLLGLENSALHIGHFRLRHSNLLTYSMLVIKGFVTWYSANREKLIIILGQETSLSKLRRCLLLLRLSFGVFSKAAGIISLSSSAYALMALLSLFVWGKVAMLKNFTVHPSCTNVLDGHHRYYAYRELGSKEIDCALAGDYSCVVFYLTQHGYFQPRAEFTEGVRQPAVRLHQNLKQFLTNFQN